MNGTMRSQLWLPPVQVRVVIVGLPISMAVAMCGWIACCGNIVYAQSYTPIELQPYRASIVLVRSPGQSDEDITAWKSGLREVIRAWLGELCQVERIDVVEAASANSWREMAGESDKVFVARVDWRGYRPRVVVMMHDLVAGESATQRAATNVLDYPRLASATFWALAACFGPRGQFESKGGGQATLRIQGSAIDVPLRDLSLRERNGFGHLVWHEKGEAIRASAMVERESPTAFRVSVDDAPAVGQNGRKVPVNGTWFVGQLATTRGTRLTVRGVEEPLAGVDVVVAPLNESEGERVVGQTDLRGEQWLARESQPLRLQLRVQGVAVWQRVVWPGAEAGVTAALSWNDEGWAAVAELGRARTAILEGETEARSLMARSLAARQADRSAEANALAEQARRRWQGVVTQWEPVVKRLQSRTWPPETARVWRSQCEDLLKRLANNPAGAR